MAQEIANNTFTGGMVLDINEIDSPSNTYCSNALNATVATYNGNEGAIQNEMGNCRIVNNGHTAKLPDNSIILGSVEYGGVIYYVLRTNKVLDQNNEPIRDENGEIVYYNEIGSFPSPDYNLDEEKSGKMIWDYQTLKVGKIDESVVPLKFQMGYNVQHHVDMLVEPSFDGSVNLILNDGNNPPRMINSGFQVQDNNNAKIIGRYNNNNTNRYDLTDETTFNLQTSLYRNFDLLSKFTYEGTTDGGNLKVGNYVFYAVSCDKDGNESDIICESGVMSVFIGEDGNPFSVNGGVGNENSYKCIKLTVENIDPAYSYIKLYYTRTTAQNNQLAETLAYKIDRLYEVQKKIENNHTIYYCTIIVSGNEVTENIAISDLNVQYFNANSAKAQALTQNMLFLANTVQDNGESSEEYDSLKKLSVKIIPKPVFGGEIDLDQDYKSETKQNYYSTQFIYDKTGYHDEEYYRFGIVYIRKDGSLTPVFNTLGYVDIEPNIDQDWDWDWDIQFDIGNTNTSKYGYNNAGVVKINYNKEGQKTLKDIIGIQFELPSSFNNETTNYKGYFFVRQKRIPTILAQGYVTNVCEEAYLPSINIANTHVNAQNKSDQYYYTYESFAKSGFINVDINTLDKDLFSNRSSSSKLGYLLRHNYKQHLFALTDESYVYFDRIGSKGPMSSYYNVINGDFNNIDLTVPGYYEIHGFNEDEDEFLTVCSHTDFYHFVKVDLIDAPPTDEGWSKVDSENPGPWNDDYYSNINPNQELYFNSTSKKFALIASIDSYTFEQEAQVSGRPIGEGNLEKNGDTIIGRKWEYHDDDLYYPARYVSDSYSQTNIDVGVNPWVQASRSMNSTLNKKTMNNVPLWISVEGKYYTYLCFGPGAPKTNNDTAYLSKFVELETTITNEDSEIGGNDSYLNRGYSLIAPTFNGKYGYIEYNKGEDKAAFKFRPMEKNSYAIFCPEYELNRPYYNNLFTGNKYILKSVTDPKGLESNKQRLYTYNETAINNGELTKESYLINVQEGVSLVSLLHNQNPDNPYGIVLDKVSYFSTKAGNASEVGFKFAGAEFLAYVYPYSYDKEKLKNNNYKLHTKYPFNIVRGIYSPYVGAYSDKNIANTVVNIYAPETGDLIENRAQNSSQYYAISDRIDISNTQPDVCYRGDCYIGYFTHRVNRNFQDPTAPYNDTIIDSKSFFNGFKECFSTEYRTFDTTKDGAKHFNLGDINAIRLGSWVTFPVRSTMNVCLRAVDRSYVDERLLCGNDRSFYPLHGIDASGSYKISESDAFNVGFNKSGSERIYFNINQLVYNKVYYKNRICYSNILQSSALTNGNRVFLSEHYRDYTEQYGEIIKLIDISGNLLVVCEHGIMLVPVNERALVSEADGGPITVNSTNVLPENPKIISDTYGSQWEESIISTPYGVYGIDASNKKIWWTDGNILKTISDFKVQEFLNNYLQVNQIKDITKCNIKTHYIKYKNDVIFTLYDDYESKPNYWNLCWNINEEAFKTFYSWIPYDSQNIGNNLVSVPLPILLKDEHEHKHYPKEKGSSTVGEVTRYDSDGIICGSKLEDRKFYLWKHGHSNMIPTSERILPTKFYDNQHPFEFEFIVKEKPDIHKIFDNLQIISNKAAPESFHYEIVGECYDFGKLKKTAYIRQEALKKLYNTSCEGDIKYDVCDNENVSYDESNFGRAVIFPLYYKRVDKPNLIYDEYKNMFAKDYNYDNLSGTELVHYKKLDEYRLVNHVKAVDIRGKGGQLRGNMQYKEDKWDVQINPINYVVGNESKKTWKDDKPPILLANIKLDEQYDGKQLYIPNDTNVYVQWKISERKEVKVKDKFIKIKVRYTGNELAIISAIKTLYTISYA